MDPLSDVIALLRPHAAFSKPITGRGSWAVRYPADDAPSFSIITSGRCLITLGDGPAELLERGDFILLPATPTFTLSTEPGLACVPGHASTAGVRHGDPEGDPDFTSLGGKFEVESVNAPLLLGLLPQMIHIRATEYDTSRLARIIALILDECADERPGREMILQRLVEVMLVESLRWHSNKAEAAHRGMLAGLRDPAISAALRAMHGDVRHGWTVAEMAKMAGMSRSGFATRFAAMVGCAPMEYLLRWRMSLAQDALGRGARSLDRVADEIGYQSASAFSTAFRRRMGCAPGAFARALAGRPRTPPVERLMMPADMKA